MPMHACKERDIKRGLPAEGRQRKPGHACVHALPSAHLLLLGELRLQPLDLLGGDLQRALQVARRAGGGTGSGLRHLLLDHGLRHLLLARELHRLRESSMLTHRASAMPASRCGMRHAGWAWQTQVWKGHSGTLTFAARSLRTSASSFFVFSSSSAKWCKASSAAIGGGAWSTCSCSSSSSSIHMMLCWSVITMAGPPGAVVVASGWSSQDVCVGGGAPTPRQPR